VDLTHEGKGALPTSLPGGGYFTFSPDGQWFVTNQGDDALRFLKVDTWEEDFALSTGDIDGYYLQFSNDSQLLVYAREACGFIVWNTYSRNLVQLQQYECNIIPNSQYVLPFIDSQSYVFSDMTTNKLSIFDMKTGNERFTINTHSFSWALSNDSVLLAISDKEHNIEIWNTYTQQQIGYLKYDAEVAELMGLGFLPDGNLWTDWHYAWFPADGEPFRETRLEVWDINTLELETTLIKGLGYASVNVINGSSLAIVSGLGASCLCGKVFIIDLGTLETLGESGGNYYVSVNPMNTIYADYSGTAQQVVIREIGKPKPLAYLDAGSTWDVEFSPDGRYMFTNGQNIQLWAVPKIEG